MDEIQKEIERLRGKALCISGQPVPRDATPELIAGYSRQYTIEAAESAQGAGNEHN